MSERSCGGCGTHLGSAWREDLCVICIARSGRRVDKCFACGESVSLAHDPGVVRAHRCVDCDAVFCRACIREHFASSARAEEIDTLRTRLAAAERERDEARFALTILAGEVRVVGGLRVPDTFHLAQFTLYAVKRDHRALDTAHSTGRTAGLREAAAACRSVADAFALRANQAAHMSTSHRNATAGVVAVERAMSTILALLGPGEVGGE